MPYPLDDTIAAVASPAGGAARGMVRVSGPQALTCVTAMCDESVRALIARASVVRAVEACWKIEGFAAPVPATLYLWPDARSFTAQPVVEIHTLGSPPLLEAVLAAVCRRGARLAAPGEFTLRAFLAGRLDLTQAEAVLGVIDATAPDELQTALAQLAGGLGRPLDRLRDELIDLAAHLEAGFDFPDEDLPFIASGEIARRLAAAATHVDALLAQLEQRGQSSARVRAVLLGPPNAGKSSLFNALAGTSALVSPVAGTTRDYLVAELDLDGVRCELVDTAGIEPAGGRVGEFADAARHATQQAAREAQVRLVCVDSTQPPAARHAHLLTGDDGLQILLLTKCDAPSHPALGNRAGLPVSSRTGAGLDMLRATLRRKALEVPGRTAGIVAATGTRCRESLTRAAEGLRLAEQALRDGLGEELLAVEIRTALDEIGKVVGAVYTDDVLDRVFSRFCIGK